ncbi:MAG: serine hydrolase domain-containing protein [Desulfobacteraceae bacterium]|jgi:CubicO group peptidase (beta-lactamase class C family)
MKRLILFFFLQFNLWTCLYGCATAPAPILPSSGDSNLAVLLESVRAEERLPAFAAAVIIDGDLYAAAAVGTRKFGSENWVSIDDSFLIASCSKAFTATLAAVLIEKGVLSWNTTLREAYPHLEMRKEYEKISLIQLLSHRAGLPEWIDHRNGFGKKWGVDEKLPTLMRFKYLKETVKQELVDEPDNSVFYSNSGYIMAGAMLEKIAGKSYELLMIKEILNPLGLHTAGFGPPLNLSSTYQPSGHRAAGWSPTPVSRDFPAYMAPTAAIHISIVDWAKFVLFHLKPEINGKVILSNDVLQKLHTPPNDAGWRDDAEENGYGVPSLNYALGWYTLDIGDKKGLLWHPGGNTGFIAQVIMDPGHNNAIMVVTNVREKHKRLFKAMSRIKEYYSAIADLPTIK